MNTETDQSMAVQVHQLSRSFRGKQALCDVNLTIPQGSVFGLVGTQRGRKNHFDSALDGTTKGEARERAGPR